MDDGTLFLLTAQYDDDTIEMMKRKSFGKSTIKSSKSSVGAKSMNVSFGKKSKMDTEANIVMRVFSYDNID